MILNEELREIIDKLDDLPTTIIMVPDEDGMRHITQTCVEKHKVMEILTGVKTS